MHDDYARAEAREQPDARAAPTSKRPAPVAGPRTGALFTELRGEINEAILSSPRLTSADKEVAALHAAHISREDFISTGYLHCWVGEEFLQAYGGNISPAKIQRGRRSMREIGLVTMTPRGKWRAPDCCFDIETARTINRQRKARCQAVRQRRDARSQPRDLATEPEIPPAAFDSSPDRSAQARTHGRDRSAFEDGKVSKSGAHRSAVSPDRSAQARTESVEEQPPEKDPPEREPSAPRAREEGDLGILDPREEPEPYAGAPASRIERHPQAHLASAGCTVDEYAPPSDIARWICEKVPDLAAMIYDAAEREAEDIATGDETEHAATPRERRLRGEAIAEIVDRFKDHCRETGRKIEDFDAAFRSWLGKEPEHWGRRHGQGRSQHRAAANRNLGADTREDIIELYEARRRSGE